MATEQHPLVAELEDAWERRDKVAAFKVVSALMGEAEAEANLAAAATAIDSNLSKLDEIKNLGELLKRMHDEARDGHGQFCGCEFCMAVRHELRRLGYDSQQEAS